jgi:hydroxymethylpyrimidine/phosphomethylpyrimidine kinase
MPKPVALTIAGSDSGGGAGIQADIKSMEAHGVFATSVITAITAQNTQGVNSAFDLPTDIIAAQIDAVADDFEVGAVKTGMLSSIAIIEVVADRLRQRGLRPLVVDPVMISKTGFALLAEDAVEAVRDLMLPLADLVTPNAHEAERLTGRPVKNLDDAERASRLIHAMGPGAVLVKGGHLDGDDDSVDVLFDGHAIRHYRGVRHDTPHTHGTGCTYASAIAARLARGEALPQAVQHAHHYVSEAIRHALALGKGRGPTNHFYFIGDGAPTTGADGLSRDTPARI